MTFFLLTIAGMLGYAVQGTLLAHHVRKHNGLSVATIRNLSLALTMLPLLFLATPRNFIHIPQFTWQFIIAGCVGAGSIWISYEALNFLPVGLKAAFGSMGSVLFVFLLSWVWFHEVPTFIEFAWLIPLIVGGIALSMQKTKLDHLDARAGIGIGLTLLSAILFSLTFVQISSISRELDPFIAGYFWEVSIGLWALLFGIIRWITCGKLPFGKIKMKDASKIALVSAPTLIGTGCFSLAVTMGPVGIVNAIGSGGIFVCILMGHWLYREKMTRQQWLWIGVSVIGLIGLGLAG